RVYGADLPPSLTANCRWLWRNTLPECQTSRDGAAEQYSSGDKLESRRRPWLCHPSEFVILQMKVCQFALRDGVPVSEFGFLFLVDSEVGLCMLDRRNQLINQCSVVHRLAPLARIPVHRNRFAASRLGDSFILGRAGLSVVPVTALT